MFDWITAFIERSGYLGIAALMLLEHAFPPIPSELIMPLAGYAAAQGELGIVPAILAGTAGSVAGTLGWYAIGRWIGCARLERFAARHGRWLTLAPHEIDDAVGWFRRHCGKSVLLGRLVPGLRTLISIPAGIAGMSIGRYVAYTTIGTALWTAALGTAGYLLGAEYGQVSGWMNPVTNVVMALLALGYLYRVVTFSPGRRRAG